MLMMEARDEYKGPYWRADTKRMHCRKERSTSTKKTELPISKNDTCRQEQHDFDHLNFHKLSRIGHGCPPDGLR